MRELTCEGWSGGHERCRRERDEQARPARPADERGMAWWAQERLGGYGPPSGKSEAKI